MTSIRHLTRNQVDTTKWDQCVQAAPNGLIYAYTFYLDHMAAHWDALVWGDYDAVMPLPWKKKWGIKYLYWVPFTQQMGVFSVREPAALLVPHFLQEVHRHFKYGEVFLNYDNTGVASAAVHTNFILPLQAEYAEIRKGYKTDFIKKNLDKINEASLYYEHVLEPATALQAYKQAYQDKIGVIRPAEYQQFEQLAGVAQQQGAVLLRGVKGKDGNWLATALLLKKNNRLHLLLSTTSPDGRKVFANHFLMDQLIREFAGSGIVFDFEGSDIPGIAHFYKGFGSINQPYFVYRFNALPWWIKWIK